MQPPPSGDEWLGLSGEALPVAAAADWVVRPDCGAVVVFSGTARDHAPGRPGVEQLETRTDFVGYDERWWTRFVELQEADVLRHQHPKRCWKPCTGGKGGQLPTAGLMSSVGVTNPPLFIYLLIPMFFVTKSIALVSCFIAAFGLAAVVACWWVGRKYYGPVAGLLAAALFATSPWAIIYSRKIWAQDFVPIFATATMWAVHSICLGNRPKAIFWCVLLPISSRT